MKTPNRWARGWFPFVYACLASIVQPSAQSADVLLLENFSERLSRDVPVSGRVLVGAVVLAPAKPSLTPTLLWRGAAIESTKEPLCVALVSRDGQYYGEGEVRASTLVGLTGTVRVQGGHRQSEREFLARLEPDDLAMLATRGDCRLGPAQGKPTVHVLDRNGTASTRQGSGPDFVIRLLLNSMTYTLGVEAVIPGVTGTRTAACRTLDDNKRNTAFNTVCELTVPNVATEADLVIRRRRYERPLSPIELKLAWSPR
jgi:hypothetical protein